MSRRVKVAEELVATKTFPARERAGMDVGALLMPQAAGLKSATVWGELGPLFELNEPPQNEGRLQEMRARLEAP